MRRDIHDIEIKEPPLREFDKKRSCFKRSCLTGCGCLFLVLIAIPLLTNFAFKTRPKELKDLPTNFPADVAVYDTEAIHAITYTSADDRGTWQKRLASLPQLALTPPLSYLRDHSYTGADHAVWDGLLSSLDNSASQKYDTARLEWTDLSAQPAFIDEYYRNELAKHEYKISNNVKTQTIRQFSFQKAGTTGAVYIEDDPAIDGTSRITLTVQYTAP